MWSVKAKKHVDGKQTGGMTLFSLCHPLKWEHRVKDGLK